MITKNQDNDAKWWGQLPNEWRVVKLKHIALLQLSNVDKHTIEGQESVELCNYTDVYKNERITSVIPFMRASATDEQIKRLSIQKSDVLLTKDSETPDDIGVPAVVAEELTGVVCGYHLAIARPNPDVVIGEFLFRAIQSEPLKKYFFSKAVGMTRYGLDKQALAETPIALPDLEEQRAIAAYLDRETAKLDALIAATEELLTLLAEKRRALITHAVTRGLNPAASMRDSGIEWLGEIPAHWEVVSLKHLAQVRNGVTKGRNLDSNKSVLVPYLRVANVQDGYVDLSDVAEIEVLPDEIPNFSLKKGDVLMNEGGDADKLGRGAVWDGIIDPCLHQNHVFAVRCFNVDPAWLSTVSKSDVTVQGYLPENSK